MVRSSASTARRSKRFVNPRSRSADPSDFMKPSPSNFLFDRPEHGLKMFRHGESARAKFRPTARRSARWEREEDQRVPTVAPRSIGARAVELQRQPSSIFWKANTFSIRIRRDTGKLSRLSSGDDFAGLPSLISQHVPVQLEAIEL